MGFKYKIQEFQTKAAAAVTHVFDGQSSGSSQYVLDSGIDEKQNQPALGEMMMSFGWKNAEIRPEVRVNLLKKINEIQKENGISPSSQLESSAGCAINLTVEMETGVGKTYTYIKTIHELYKQYGWMKYIIVVPSIAIREGVRASLKSLEEHFLADYKQKITFFVYDSDKLGELGNFARDSGIHVMIINSQAFNTGFDSQNNNKKAKGEAKAARIIFNHNDQTMGCRPIDMLAAMRPIIIIDEPQTVEGREDGATANAIREFNPLFILRYSATHIRQYNLVYRLDAIDAMQMKLVKKIAVKAITPTSISGTEGTVCLLGFKVGQGEPKARLKFNKQTKNGITMTEEDATTGFNLYEKSGKLSEYQNNYILEYIDATDNGYIRFRNGLELKEGTGNYDFQMEQIRRVQIQETIRTHLEQEERLFSRGIKCLSLFFIDEVKNYREYENNKAKNGIYAQWFEDEYKSIVKEYLTSNTHTLLPEYVEWLKMQNAETCHTGYFAVDKENRMTDPLNGKSEKANKQNQDTFDLIMRGKEKLIQYDDPEGGKVRFIFSHSALKEGWDNPNVFQICTLKDSDANIRKRQEIGRGMRLCVNKDLVRQDESVLGKEVFDVNTLVVIASESYDDFANNLQKEILESLSEDRRQIKVTPELFKAKAYRRKDGSEGIIDDNFALKIYNKLIKKDFVDDDGKLTKAYEDARNARQVEWEDLDISQESIVSILGTLVDSNTGRPTDASKPKTQKFLRERFKSSKEFQALWERIRTQSTYSVSFDSKELITSVVKELDEHLVVPKIEVLIERGEQTEKTSTEGLANGLGMTRTNSKAAHEKLAINPNYRCDLLGRIVELTDLTRHDVAEILGKIKPETFMKFKNNPELFIVKVSKIINDVKAEMIIKNIIYKPIDKKFGMEIFTNGLRKVYSDSRVVEGIKKGVYDLFVLDSDVEEKFCNELEINKEVLVYTKLPNGFYIDTPVGKYNPDWAIVLDKEGHEHIFFVAETKGTEEINKLRGTEAAKIACGEAHFHALSSQNGKKILYHCVSSYQSLHDKLDDIK